MTKSKDESKIALKSKSNSTAVSKTISSYFPAISKPLNKPNIDNDFNNLPAIERVTEALRYNLLSIEYSISPKGGLRQWIKINLSLLLFFGIPILIFVPLATYLMGGFENISVLLENSTQLVLMAAQNVLKLIVVIIVIGSILYIIFKLLSLRYSSKKKESESEKDDFIDVTQNNKGR
jgi:hypothetical protein